MVARGRVAPSARRHRRVWRRLEATPNIGAGHMHRAADRVEVDDDAARDQRATSRRGWLAFKKCDACIMRRRKIKAASRKTYRLAAGRPAGATAHLPPEILAQRAPRILSIAMAVNKLEGQYGPITLLTVHTCA